MKHRIYLTVAIIMLFSKGISKTYSRQNKTVKAIWYYVDATCENCMLNKVSGKNNYWLVTTKVFQTYSLNTDSILTAFKQQVKKQYPVLTRNYVRTTVIRWQNSFKETTRSLENKRQKMLSREYTEIKID